MNFSLDRKSKAKPNFYPFSGRFKIFEGEGDTPEAVASLTVKGLRLNKRYVFMGTIHAIFFRNFP